MMQEYGNTVKLLSDFEILNQVSFSLSYLKFVVVYSPWHIWLQYAFPCHHFVFWWGVVVFWGRGGLKAFIIMFNK